MSGSILAPALAEEVLVTAIRFGYPRAVIAIPNRRSPLTIEPTPEAWGRAVDALRRSPGALLILFRGLLAADVELYRALYDETETQSAQSRSRGRGRNNDG